MRYRARAVSFLGKGIGFDGCGAYVICLLDVRCGNDYSVYSAGWVNCMKVFNSLFIFCSLSSGFDGWMYSMVD